MGKMPKMAKSISSKKGLVAGGDLLTVTVTLPLALGVGPAEEFTHESARGFQGIEALAGRMANPQTPPQEIA